MKPKSHLLSNKISKKVQCSNKDQQYFNKTKNIWKHSKKSVPSATERIIENESQEVQFGDLIHCHNFKNKFIESQMHATQYESPNVRRRQSVNVLPILGKFKQGQVSVRKPFCVTRHYSTKDIMVKLPFETMPKIIKVNGLLKPDEKSVVKSPKKLILLKKDINLNPNQERYSDHQFSTIKEFDNSAHCNISPSITKAGSNDLQEIQFYHTRNPSFTKMIDINSNISHGLRTMKTINIVSSKSPIDKINIKEKNHYKMNNTIKGSKYYANNFSLKATSESPIRRQSVLLSNLFKCHLNSLSGICSFVSSEPKTLQINNSSESPILKSCGIKEVLRVKPNKKIIKIMRESWEKVNQ